MKIETRGSGRRAFVVWVLLTSVGVLSGAPGGAGGAIGLSAASPSALLSFPVSTTAESGAVIQVPISVAPGDGILGIDVTFTYAPAVLQALSVTPSGLAEAAGFGLVANLNTPGVILISAYATGDALSGSGEIALVEFRVLGGAGASSPLAFTRATINEGQIAPAFRNGTLTAVAATTLLSMPGDIQVGSGSTVSVPISASPADDILGIDMVVRYDPSVVLAQSVTVSGIAATAGFAVVANLNTPGVIIISTYATTNGLHGSGEILRIDFAAPGSPGASSSLRFASASINEGTIPVALSHGLVIITCAGAADDTPCNDGNPATCGDVCSGGVCTGAAVPEPAEVNDSVRVGQSGADTIISWNDPPGPFNAYRGSIADEVPFVYNQVCLDPGIEASGQSVTDTVVPPVGTGFYYLVTRVDRCRESIPGRDSAGIPIPNAQPCAAAGP